MAYNHEILFDELMESAVNKGTIVRIKKISTLLARGDGIE